MSETFLHGTSTASPASGIGLRALGAAVLVAAAAGAVLSATPAVGPAHPGTRCEDRQVATAWLSERCAADLFAERP